MAFLALPGPHSASAGKAIPSGIYPTTARSASLGVGVLPRLQPQCQVLGYLHARAAAAAAATRLTAGSRRLTAFATSPARDRSFSSPAAAMAHEAIHCSSE